MSSAITFYKKICSEEQVEYNHKQELLIYELDKFLSYKKKSFILKIFDTPSNGKKKCLTEKNIGTKYQCLFQAT